MKESKLMSFKIDMIRQDETFRHTWRNKENSALFAKAIEKFKHYTHPVGYIKDGYANVFGHWTSLNALKELEQDEAQVEILDIKEVDVVPFLIAYLPKEHLQPKSIVQLVELILQYASTPEGKTWFKSVCNSQMKHVRLATILDTSTYVINACLYLLQPGNEQYLKMLDDPKVSLTEAYTEGRKNGKDPKGTTSSSDSSTTQSENTNPKRSAGPSVTAEPSGNNSPANKRDPHANDPSNAATEGADDVDEVAYPKSLDKYRKEKTEAPEKPEKDFAIKVIVALSDGTQLELAGKIDLVVDGIPIRSTEQLVKGADGKWSLPKHYAPVSLIVDTGSAASQTSK